MRSIDRSNILSILAQKYSKSKVSLKYSSHETKKRSISGRESIYDIHHRLVVHINLLKTSLNKHIAY